MRVALGHRRVVSMIVVVVVVAVGMGIPLILLRVRQYYLQFKAKKLYHRVEH